jgi:ATP-dependent Zn protease
MESDRNPFLGRSLGMSDKYSDKTKQTFDDESLELINEAYYDAIILIQKNKILFEEFVNILRQNVTLYGDFVNEYVVQNNYTILTTITHETTNIFDW